MRFDKLRAACSLGFLTMSRCRSLAWRVCIAAAICFAFSPIVQAAEPSGKDSSTAVWAAVITGAVTMIGLILQLGYNARETRRAEKLKAKEEQRQRQRELALKIADLVGKDQTAARRFAIGLIKVEKVGDDEQTKKSTTRGKVYFIPVNSRFSVGRDSGNDIHLIDPALPELLNRELSRYQCGFVADEQHVVVEDFNSKNGTFVSDTNGDETVNLEEGPVKFAKVRQRTLADRDCIWIGPFVLRFVKLQQNEILR